MIANRTIDDLLKQVPEGETRLFEAPIKDAVEDRFFAVHGSWDYKPGRLLWLNRPPREQKPWFGARLVPRVPISASSLPEAIFEGPAKDIVDFYTTGSDAYFISNRLAELIKKIDPDSLDRRAMKIKANDACIDYNVVMPARLLEAVDPARTDILIEDKDLAGQWFRYIQFPNGVVFRDAELAGIHSFADIDSHYWFWSRELIDAAKAEGIKGLYTMRAGRITGAEIDSL